MLVKVSNSTAPPAHGLIVTLFISATFGRPIDQSACHSSVDMRSNTTAGSMPTSLIPASIDCRYMTDRATAFSVSAIACFVPIKGGRDDVRPT